MFSEGQLMLRNGPGFDKDASFDTNSTHFACMFCQSRVENDSHSANGTEVTKRLIIIMFKRLFFFRCTSFATTFQVTRRVNIVSYKQQISRAANVYSRWCLKTSEGTILQLPGKFETF